MTIKDKQLQSDSNREVAKKYLHYHQVKLRNMKILQVKKYYLLIKGE